MKSHLTVMAWTLVYDLFPTQLAVFNTSHLCYVMIAKKRRLDQLYIIANITRPQA